MRGLSLIEMILVVALLAVIASFGAYESLRDFTSLLAGSNVEQVEQLFLQARNDSVRGICYVAVCRDTPVHSVHVTSSGLISFEGSDFKTRDSTTDLTVPIRITNAPFPYDVIYDAQGKTDSTRSIELPFVTHSQWRVISLPSGTVQVVSGTQYPR